MGESAPTPVLARFFQPHCVRAPAASVSHACVPASLMESLIESVCHRKRAVCSQSRCLPLLLCELGKLCTVCRLGADGASLSLRGRTVAVLSFRRTERIL